MHWFFLSQAAKKSLAEQYADVTPAQAASFRAVDCLRRPDEEVRVFDALLPPILCPPAIF